MRAQRFLTAPLIGGYRWPTFGPARRRALAALGMKRPLAAQCDLGLGRLSRGAHRRQMAQEHFTTTTMCRETGSSSWLDGADTELAEQY